LKFQWLLCHIFSSVAFTHSEWRTRPLIGKAEHITRKTTRIHWWEGSCTTVWKPSNRRQGRQTISRVEEIPTENIIFSFPWKQKEGRLPLKIKDKLNELYEQWRLCQQCTDLIINFFFKFKFSTSDTSSMMFASTCEGRITNLLLDSQFSRHLLAWATQLYDTPPWNTANSSNVCPGSHQLSTHHRLVFLNHRLYKTLDAEWHWCRYEYQARKNIPSVCTFVEKAAVGWLASNRHQVLDDIDVVNDEWLIQEGEVAKTAVLEYADWLVTTMNNSIPDESWLVPVSASPLHFEYYGPWRYWLPWHCQHSAKTYKM